MKISKTAVILGVVAIGAGVWAWRESWRRHEIDAARITLVRKQAAVVARSSSLEARKTAAAARTEESRNALRKSSADVRDGGRPAEAKKKAPTGADATSPWERAVRRDPVQQALEVAVMRARQTVQFRSLFRELGLSPAQQEMFLQNRVTWAERVADVQAATEAMELSDKDPAVVRMMEQAFQEFAAAQRALLGEAGLQRTTDFERSMPVREAVQDLAGATLAVGEPLTWQQAEKIAQVLVDDAKLTTHSASATPSDVNWERVDAQVRTILNDAQFAVFQTTEPKMEGVGARYMARLRNLIVQAQRAEAKAASAATTGR